MTLALSSLLYRHTSYVYHIMYVLLTIHMYVCNNMCILVCAWMFACMHACLCMHVCVCVCVCVCVHAHAREDRSTSWVCVIWLSTWNLSFLGPLLKVCQILQPVYNYDKWSRLKLPFVDNIFTKLTLSNTPAVYTPFLSCTYTHALMETPLYLRAVYSGLLVLSFKCLCAVYILFLGGGRGVWTVYL